MDLNKTEIMVIMDSSGSMQGDRKKFAINGYNEFIQEQKKVPGECNVSLMTFNTEIEKMYFGKPIKKVKELENSDFTCEGMTAINDTLGKSINELGVRLRDMDEDKRPGKVIVVVLTDGEENSSKEFTYQQVKDMMDHQRDVYNWQFLVMGSKEINIESDGQYAGFTGTKGPQGPRGIAGDIGLDGVAEKMFRMSSASVTRYRMSEVNAVGYEDVDDEQLMTFSQDA